MARDPVIAGDDCHDRAQDSRRPAVEAASHAATFSMRPANFWTFSNAPKSSANAS